MYKKYICSVVTNEYSYHFEVVEENRAKAQNKAQDYVIHTFKDKDLIGGSNETTDIISSEKSIELVEKIEHELPFFPI